MPDINDGGDLYAALEPLNLLEKKPPMWWPSYGTFEVLVGAILTQNAQWTKVEHSLENLRNNNFMTLESIAELDIGILMELIQPSGLYKSKAKYLKTLCQNIVETYGDYESFCFETDREWLLSQKGVGPETADSILCYSCRRPAMTVDAYTARLVSALGYEFESYDELQAWCENGLYGSGEELAQTYALFHGMIVEYVKRNKKGKNEVDVEGLIV
jgi:endonuclease-3 related protein